MNTEDSIKHYLNSLSQAPGSLLYRDAIEWKALAPGHPDDSLFLDNAGLPVWLPTNPYNPAGHLFNGSSTYWNKTSVPVSNNPLNLVQRFRCNPQPATAPLFFLQTPAFWVFAVFMLTDGHLQPHVWNSAGTLICRLASLQAFDDDAWHNLFFTFTPATAAFQFRVDLVDQDDTAYLGRTLTTGTLPTLNTGTLRIGADTFGPRYFTGQLSYTGFKQATARTESDFFDDRNFPLPINETTWPAWSGRPLLWHESCRLDENKGSFGAMTKTGPILLSAATTWR